LFYEKKNNNHSNTCRIVNSPKKVGPAKAGPFFYINIVCKEASKMWIVLETVPRLLE